MILFLFKGLIRDPSRSIFPVITVTVGVMLTVVLYSWIQGLQGELVKASARFSTGHVKVSTRAYAMEEDQLPNDLSLLGVDTLVRSLRQRFPEFLWSPRIRFGGLLDIPDARGETRAQGPVGGFAINLLQEHSPDRQMLNLGQALVRGRLPSNKGEALLSDELAERLGVGIGETATLIGATRHGSLATANFMIAGTIRFGITVLDRGTIIADLADVQEALDMTDAAGEVFGFMSDELYRDDVANRTAEGFNAQVPPTAGEFAPVMVTLRNQGGLGQTLDVWEYLTGILVAIFVVVMSIVLWNAGLMASLRRYGEIGMRLALGEAKGRLYRAMLAESVMIGIIGSILGSAIGVAVATYLQETGIDIGSMMKNASIMLANVLRARVTPTSYVIGFIPGLCATFLGTSIAGLGIYRRQTAQLAKELQS